MTVSAFEELVLDELASVRRAIQRLSPEPVLDVFKEFLSRPAPRTVDEWVNQPPCGFVIQYRNGDLARSAAELNNQGMTWRQAIDALHLVEGTDWQKIPIPGHSKADLSDIDFF